ncbi:MAG: hypothetical protein SFV51_27605 [Bryobacteraceae bacterium]|nr:hypothetical protein [Bryobacteraceae bacterium]
MVYTLMLAAWMQFTPPPQARTPEEYDAYLDVAEAAAPGEALDAAKRFQREYPKSELRSRVLEHCLEAYRKTGDRQRAITAGEASLEANPHNVALRATLSALIANGADEGERIRAEAHARRALDELSRFRPPRSISPADWRRMEGGIRAAAHSALGLVAFGRDRTAEAIGEFEQAVRHNADAAVYYRLGKLYQLTGRKAEAMALFRRAAGGGEPLVRALAEKELER